MDVGSRSDCSGKAAGGVIIRSSPSARSPASATRAVNASADSASSSRACASGADQTIEMRRPGQRQPREHAAVRAKPLPRAAVMRELALEIRDDALLAVRLRLGDDARRAGAPTS